MNTRDTLTVLYAAGVNPGKWFQRWRDRYPEVTLKALRYDGDAASASWLTEAAAGPEITEISGAGGESVDAPVDFFFARLPLDDSSEDTAVIPLYEEVSVVVANRDHEIAAFEELELADVAGEARLATRFDPDAAAGSDEGPNAELTVEQIMATAASGAVIAVVPHSLARLYARKDAVSRVLADGPRHPVGLAFSHAAKAANEELFEAFIGVVRGRTERSSRQPEVSEKVARKKPAAKAKSQSPGNRKPGQNRQKRSRRGGRGR